MPKIPQPKYLYLAYIRANDMNFLSGVSKTASTVFAQQKVEISTKYVSNNNSVILISSDEVIAADSIATFESRTKGDRYSDILFSYVSIAPVYLFSLYVAYQADEGEHSLAAENYRRNLAYGAYDLTSAGVKHFYQSTTTTSMVLTSRFPIPDNDTDALLKLAKAMKISIFIPFTSY